MYEFTGFASEAAAASDETGGNPWVALAIVVGGIAIGVIAARIVNTVLSGESRPRLVRSIASAVSALVFSVVLIAALITALGVVSPSALDQLQDDFVGFIPEVLAASIVLVVANVIAQLLETAANGALVHASPIVRRRLPPLLRYAVLGFAGIIAANQLGVDTTIVTVVVASLFFGLALAAALLAGLGGRNVAAELAAGRALRQVLSVGDTVTTEHVEGIVAAIGSTTTQITATDRVVLVPNAELLSLTMVVVPRSTTSDDVDS